MDGETGLEPFARSIVLAGEEVSPSKVVEDEAHFDLTIQRAPFSHRVRAEPLGCDAVAPPRGELCPGGEEARPFLHGIEGKGLKGGVHASKALGEVRMD